MPNHNPSPFCLKLSIFCTFSPCLILCSQRARIDDYIIAETSQQSIDCNQTTLTSPLRCPLPDRAEQLYVQAKRAKTRASQLPSSGAVPPKGPASGQLPWHSRFIREVSAAGGSSSVESEAPPRPPGPPPRAEPSSKWPKRGAEGQSPSAPGSEDANLPAAMHGSTLLDNLSGREAFRKEEGNSPLDPGFQAPLKDLRYLSAGNEACMHPWPPQQRGVQTAGVGQPPAGRVESPRQSGVQPAVPSERPERGQPSAPQSAPGNATYTRQIELEPACAEVGVMCRTVEGVDRPSRALPAAQRPPETKKPAPLVVGGLAGGFRRVARATPPAAKQVGTSPPSIAPFLPPKFALQS